MAKVKKGTKACPFCGKADTLRLVTDHELMLEYGRKKKTLPDYVNWVVLCDATTPGGPGGCGASGGYGKTKEIALMKWERRA